MNQTAYIFQPSSLIHYHYYMATLKRNTKMTDLFSAHQRKNRGSTKCLTLKRCFDGASSAFPGILLLTNDPQLLTHPQGSA